MAIEVISKVLAPDKAPYINGVSAGRKLSEALLENMYQGLVETNGKGITDKFTTDADVNENAQIFVNRILPVDMQPREQGASVNGGSFSKYQHYTQTTTVSIPLLITIDDTIVIPGSRQRMIKTDLLAEQTSIYGDRLNTIINGATAAAKLLATMVADVEGKDFNLVDITEADITEKKVIDKVMEANDLLELGDPANGIDIFPEKTRIAVFKAGVRHILKAAGVLTLGGSNYAQEILQNKALSTGAQARTTEDGYIGDIDGVPCHTISNESLRHADGFLGLPKGTTMNSTFFGYVSSSYANARGVSMVDQVKVVDAIDGQGVIFQPFTKMGVISWYPKGNVILTRNGNGHTLFHDLKKVFTGEYKFMLKAAGSRLFPHYVAIRATTSQLTLDVQAKDDGVGALGANHAVEGYYYVGKQAASTAADFLTLYGAASHKGKCTSLTGNTAITATSSDLVCVMSVADDGSFSIGSVKVSG